MSGLPGERIVFLSVFFSHFFLFFRYQYFVVDPLAEYNMPQYILREFKVTKICLLSFLYISPLRAE